MGALNVEQSESISSTEYCPFRARAATTSNPHMFVSKYLLVVSGLQVISGALLLINRYVPLALTILGPIIVNILLFHGLMNPAGLGLAVFVTIFWGLVFVSVRSAFAGIFQASVDTKTAPARRPVGVSSATA